MTMLGILLFGLALACAIFAILATILPNLDRVADALAGRSGHFAPLDVAPVRRRLVRHWQVAPARPASPSRAAA